MNSASKASGARPRIYKMLVRATPLTAALAFAYGGSAYAAAYLVMPIPVKATQTRTATCDEAYGTIAAPLISYEGGPLSQSRRILADHSFGPWVIESGSCLRNYLQDRDITGVCPANQAGSAVDHQERTWTLDDAGATVNDTGFVTKSSDYTCDYYYLRTETENSNQTDACPANQRGTGESRSYSRTYDVWSDASKRNYSVWTLYNTVASSCAYYYLSTNIEYTSQTAACAANQTGTGSTSYYSRTYDLWSDNTHRNISAWTVYQTTPSSCTYYYVSTQTEYMTSYDCGTDYYSSGSDVYRRTYQLWSDGSARNYTGWVYDHGDLSCYPPFSSCFPAGSMVLMADGTQKEISTIVSGDVVMGPTGPWEVDYLYRNRLGPRKMLSTEDRKFTWTQEHLIWARMGGKEWWWSGNAQGLRDEVKAGVVIGLFDNNSIMEGGRPEFANIDNGWSQVDIVDATAEYSPMTEVFEPMAPKGDRRMAFIDGFLVTCGTNQWECDYSKFHWDDKQLALVREMLEKNAMVAA